MPDPCQSIRDTVEGLKASIADLQAELRTAPPSMKPGLILLIKREKEELAQRNRELAACVREHPPSTVVFTTDTCPVCTAEQLRIWRNVVDTQLGVDGFDPVGHWIGGFPAERFGPLNNWYPLSVEKQVLCGQLHHFNFYDGLGDEADWNHFIIPSPAFAHLLEDPKVYGPDDAWHTCVRGQDCMEAEITPDESYYENILNSRQSDQSELEGQTLCAYGAWVREFVHSNRPEIHPSELYWWRGRLSEREFYYMLMLVQDDSNRYDRDGDYDFGAPWDGPPDGWRPWSQNPRAGTFMIAFELNPTGAPLTFSIRSVESLRTNPVIGDVGAERVLEYNGRAVVRVQEVDPSASRVAISFGSVCRNAADTRLQGYVVLRVAAGQGDRGGEGYQTLRVDVNRPPFLDDTGPVVADWPTLPMPERPARAVAVKAIAQPRTLRRVEVDGRPELRGDVEIRVESAPGVSPGAGDLDLARVELVEASGRRVLTVDPATPTPAAAAARRGVLRDLPAAGGGRLDVTTGSGTSVTVAAPPLTLAPRMTGATPRRVDADPVAWDAMVAAAGGRVGAAPPPVPVVRLGEWVLEAAPAYAVVRNGAASPEDDSPFTEEINGVLARRDATRVQEIFGTQQPFTVQWEFQATDLTTGQAVRVRRGASPRPSEVRVEDQPGNAFQASIQVTFPERPGGKVYELVATAKVTDVFGFQGEVRHRVSSHALALDDRGRLASLVLPTAAALAEVDPDDLLAASALGGPLTLGANNAPRKRDLRSTRGQMVRLSALAAAEDQRVDVEDLRVLIRGAKLFASTPR